MAPSQAGTTICRVFGVWPAAHSKSSERQFQLTEGRLILQVAMSDRKMHTKYQLAGASQLGSLA